MQLTPLKIFECVKAMDCFSKRIILFLDLFLIGRDPLRNIPEEGPLAKHKNGIVPMGLQRTCLSLARKPETNFMERRTGRRNDNQVMISQ